MHICTYSCSIYVLCLLYYILLCLLYYLFIIICKLFKCWCLSHTQLWSRITLNGAPGVFMGCLGSDSSWPHAKWPFSLLSYLCRPKFFLNIEHFISFIQNLGLLCHRLIAQHDMIFMLASLYWFLCYISVEQKYSIFQTTELQNRKGKRGIERRKRCL